MLRRSVRQFLPKRSWQNLSALASGPKNAEAWNELKARDAKVDMTINANTNVQAKKIDFESFEKTTSHPEIVASLKNYYAEQMEILAKLEAENGAKSVESLQKGWDVHAKAVVDLEASVEESSKIVQSGVKALWISANNPDITRVKTNEWLDTDQYFQAVVERFAGVSPSGYQYLKQKNWTDKEMEDYVSLLDSRSDVKRRYTQMEQLHSFDYYDLHRRALLEHMTYFLLRTGGDVRFFPEIPPMNWMQHIEKIRRDFAKVAHTERKERQLAALSMSEPLELNPVEYSHGEDHFAALLNQEAQQTEVVVGKLMGFYGFLSAPYIPVRSAAEAEAVAALGAGEFFSFGKDVNAVFFLPNDKALVRPVEAAHAINSTQEIGNGYKALNVAVAEVVELRGDNWLVAPGESVADAYVRRMKSDEPTKAIFEAYVAELKKKVAVASKVSKADALAHLVAVKDNIAAEEYYFEHKNFSE